MNDAEKCPCCSEMTLPKGERGDYHICKVCFWEDDGYSEDNPQDYSEVNHMTLEKARFNYSQIGAVKESMLPFVMSPEEFKKSRRKD